MGIDEEDISDIMNIYEAYLNHEAGNIIIIKEYMQVYSKISRKHLFMKVRRKG